MLEKLSSRNEYIYIVGDFNIDQINYEADIHSTRLINLFISHDLRPTISIPTRVSKHRNTLLDNIFTNFIGDKQAGVIQNNISDHSPIFISLNHKCSEAREANRKIWDYNKITSSKYTKHIDEMEFLINQNNPASELYKTFNDKLAAIHKVAFTLQEKTTNYKNKLPWIDKTLQNTIRYKNKLYIKWMKHRTQINHKKYKEYIK